jgi:hypothetical protein
MNLIDMIDQSISTLCDEYSGSTQVCSFGVNFNGRTCVYKAAAEI